VIYNNDFERLDTETNWFPLTINRNPYGTRQFLGPYGNDTVSLSLTDLPVHTNLTMAFDLLLFNSWDGNATPGPDYFNLNVDGTQMLLHTTFRNNDMAGQQSYPSTYRSNDFPGLTGALEMDTLGYAEDSVYRLNFTFPHSSNAMRLNFQGANLQIITDESWGLDNVTLLTGAPTVAIAEPANGATFASSTNVLITVNATSTVAALRQVMLLDNHILLGILTNSPYSLVWSNVPPGIHVLTARVIDAAAKAAESTITLKVNGLQGEYFANTNLAGITHSSGKTRRLTSTGSEARRWPASRGIGSP